MSFISKVFNKIFEPGFQIPDERKRFGNRALITLILPVVIEQTLSLLVGMADTFMISYAGESAVAGVALVNQVDHVFIIIFSAMAAGGSVVISQYVGVKEKENGTRAASQLVLVVSLTAIIIAAFILIGGQWLFGLLYGEVEPEVSLAGRQYMQVSACSYIFIAIYNACAGMFRSMGDTRTVMLVAVIMNVLNIAGNAVGVFALHAGVYGVAVPSLISRFVACLMMIILVQKRKGLVTIRLKNVFEWNWQMIRRVLSIALPNCAENGLFQVSKVAVTSVIALFGTAQVAAYGVAQSMWSFSAMFVLAMSTVFITVIGQYMGAGDIDGAQYYFKKLFRITLVGSFLWNAAIFGLSAAFVNAYALSDEAVHYVILLVLIHNAFNWICSMGHSMSSGLRATGDARFGMISTIVSSVCVRLILTYIMGILLHWQVIGVAIAMVCDWVVKAILIFIRYKSGKWKTFKVI